MNVIILRGVSGAGKSLYARKLVRENKGAVVVSADDYFMQNGDYVFDRDSLGEAHKQCLLKFIEAVQGDERFIVVDNTNTRMTEVAPYYSVAKAHGYRVRIVSVICSLEDLLDRSYKVPNNVICEQWQRFMKEEIPPWWKKEHEVRNG
jgi:predicted kinase